MTSDVLIAGAGPAAVAAALTCIREGFSVTMVTSPFRQIAFHENPIVALQSFHPSVERLLWEIKAVEALRLSIVRAFEELTVDGRLHPLSPCEGVPWHGYHVDRARFDKELLVRACSQGISVVHDRIVNLLFMNNRAAGVQLEHGGELRARWLIDGSGRSRAIARHLPIEQRFYSCSLLVQTGVMKRLTQRHQTEFVSNPDGWHWFTPTIAGLCTWTALSRPPHRNTPAIKKLLSRSVPGSVRIADARWRLSRPLVAPGVLMVGEAAGQLDPAYGQGVVNALYSGIMAAKALAKSAENPMLEAWYHAFYDRWFLNRFEQAAFMLKTSYEKKGILL